MSQGSDVILDRMMALHPKIIDLTLDRVWRLLEALDHPERRLPPVIHIAGTNGKGSTQAMIRAGLEADGKASTPIPRRTLHGSMNGSGSQETSSPRIT